MFGLSWPEIFVIVLGTVTLIKTILDFSSGIKDPNIKQDSEIASIKQGCVFKHTALDTLMDERIGHINDNIASLNKTLLLLQENDIKHIEIRLTDQDKSLAKLFTILEERLPRK